MSEYQTTIKKFEIRIVILISLLSVLCNPISAQRITKKMTNTGLGYLEYLPLDYASSGKAYPVIIYLHGANETGNGTTELDKVSKWGPLKAVNEGNELCFTVNGKSRCFIVIAPQTTDSVIWDLDLIDEAVDQALENYRVDKKLVFLTGFSTGGTGAWRYAYSDFNKPNRLTAIAPVSGRGDSTKLCYLADKDIAVWAFHGAKDNLFSKDSTINKVNALNRCVPAPDPEAKITLYPDGGHNASTWTKVYDITHTYQSPNLFEWFLSPNEPPLAKAGPDQVLTFPKDSTLLDGSASTDDKEITKYQWTLKSGGNVTIETPGSVSTKISGLQQGNYLFTLTVTDEEGATSSDDISIKVNPEPNDPPTASAGSDQELTLPTDSTELNGSNSTDDKGIVSYHWTKTSGGEANIAQPGEVATAITGLREGNYVFTLTVTDTNGAASSDEVSIRVNPDPNQPPVANAGPDLDITDMDKDGQEEVTLDGSGSEDAEGNITSYSWTTEESGEIATGMNPTFVLTVGKTIITLTVTDENGAIGTDKMKVTINEPENKFPVAEAGSDQVITLPTNSVTLDGNSSTDDGNIVSYVWSLKSGETATIETPESISTNVSDLKEGMYVFTLTVTDDKGVTGSDEISIQVNPEPNAAPVANAGPDQTLTLPADSTLLNGGESTDDNGVKTFQWIKKTGGKATIETPDSASTNIKGLEAGNYIFTLTVTDDNDLSHSDDVAIKVNPKPNEPPQADAGSDQKLIDANNDGQEEITLDGSGSQDPEGEMAIFSWTTENNGEIATGVNPNIILPLGETVITLTVTDSAGDAATDQVIITIKEPDNKIPVAHAGENQTIMDENKNGQEAVALDGSASTDEDGEIVAYSWTIENDVEIAAEANTTVTLPVGKTIVTLTVTDNEGDAATDRILITINAPDNKPPVANAGENQTITLPETSATLDGSNSTDPDDLVLTYYWVKKSGGNADIAQPNAAITKISGLEAGIYVFELTVTDDRDSTDTAAVTIIVEAVTGLPDGQDISDKSSKKTVVSVFPNPVDEKLTIKIAKKILSSATINFLDESGKLLYSKEVKIMGKDEVNLDLSEIKLKKGIVFLRIDTENELGNPVKLIKF